MRSASIVALLAAGLVGACATTPPPAPPPPAAPLAPPTDAAAACLAGLDQRHVAYQRIKDWHTPEGCGIDQAVQVVAEATQWNRPALLACPFAARLWDFETQVVQPAAEANLGHAVTKTSNAGSYDCRGQRSDHPERMSEHAFGLAIDITGFELDDGTRITVLQDWSAQGAKGKFLHQVAEGACHMFNVVITPNSNALHHDHLHLDNGPYKYCGK